MKQDSISFVRRDALYRWKLQFGPNMTPMVDIVLVILIFFMATAAFTGEEWFLQAAIRSETGAGGAASSAEPSEQPPLTIRVLLDVDDLGRPIASCTQLGIERQPIERVIERIGELPVGEETEPTQVMIKPSAAVPYREVVRVHEACAAAGIMKIGIGMANDPPSPRD